jgi:uncharacterized oxidoreductase
MSEEFDWKTAHVLVTGGSEGIGFGLAERMLHAGAQVLVTGRNAEKLERARSDRPGLLTFVNDIGRPEARERLADHLASALPDLNVVINNAGIQRRVALAGDDAAWATRQAEIDILLSAPVHLNHLLLPRLLARGGASLIVNVTSGGAFIPQPFAPVYSACKAALHSYTVNLRFALAGTACKVSEVIPPAVRTALAGPGATHGAPLDDFCDSVFAALTAEREEIGFGPTASPEFERRLAAEREMFDRFAVRFPVASYAHNQ